MRLLMKILGYSCAVLCFCVLALIVGVVLTPQKVPHQTDQKLISFSGTSTRASFKCPNGELFHFLISLTDNQVVSNFSGKIKLFDNDKLISERKIKTLISCNLLSHNNVKNVYAMEPDPSDGHGLNWDSFLVTNRVFVMEFECSEKLIDATLWCGYVYLDYVKRSRTRR